MTNRPSVAERFDAALDRMLAGDGAGAASAAAALDPAGRSLVALAAELPAVLPVPVVAPRFEARLGARLAGATSQRDPVGWALRHRAPLIVTGAVGSAAVGVGVTAFAVWRSSRRASGAAHRLSGR